MNVKKIAILIIPIFLFSLSVMPTFASENDSVINTNSAMVHNEVMIGANTGGNLADGSYGGSGGRGGNINNADGVEENGDIRDSVTGRGGNGGSAAIGGTVITGDATAVAMIGNDVNNNRTSIDRCGCNNVIVDEEVVEGDETQECCDGENGCCEENSRVKNMNLAMVGNRQMILANTGSNDAMGSYGGEAGIGGNINNTGNGDVDTATTGIGGNGGAGGDGGVVQTGASIARSEIMNVINTNITRTRR